MEDERLLSDSSESELIRCTCEVEVRGREGEGEVLVATKGCLTFTCDVSVLFSLALGSCKSLIPLSCWQNSA